MKKAMVTFLLLASLVFAACGSQGNSAASATSDTSAASGGSSSVTADESTSEAVSDASAAVEDASAASSEEAVSADSSAEEVAASSAGATDAYAWLGLTDMPQCKYLDLLATAHYIQTYDSYVMGLKTEVTEATDMVNTFKDDGSTRVYNVDGKAVSVNDDAKMYMEYDMGDAAALARDSLEEAMKNGTNLRGRSFVESGKGTIPLYEEDTGEYEYYEYNYPDSEAIGAAMTERFYMKDGDVFAIYQTTAVGDSDIETTQIIKEISGDIPEGTFDIPDLSGYSKYE